MRSSPGSGSPGEARRSTFGVNPDPDHTLAKGLGGGFPVAAVGGSEGGSCRSSRTARYSHSGTYNANVVACAAVSATMDLLAEARLVPAAARSRPAADGWLA